MSHNEEFDELARRKLEERQFPFQETDWQDARALIDAQRRDRNRAAWFIGAGLLLVGSVAWYGTRPATNVSDTAAVEQGNTDQPQSASAVSASAIALNHSDPTPASSAAPIANDANGTPANDHATNNALTSEVNASMGTNANAAPNGEHAAVRTATSPNASKPATAGHTETVAPATAQRHGTAPSIVATSVAVNRAGQPVPTVSQAERSSGETLGNDAHQESGSTLSSTGDQGDPQTAPSNTTGVTEDDQPLFQKGVGFEPDMTLTPSPMDEKGLVLSGGAMTVGQKPNDKPANAGTGADQPTITASPSLGDSAAAPPEFMASASTTAAAPAPEAAPPLVPDQAPWEISMIDGVFNSKSDYSGSNSAEWSGDISSEHSISVGAEFMHMGRNIGIGAGLHYGSYEERLRSNAIDVTSTSTENYWYLLPVDTTFLFITDSIPGQPTSYTGTSVDTTVNVLTHGTNTVTSTERLREARDQVNRVSYLEVPVLLDAHLVQGRWNFGLRGGPTFGLLTATHGSVPSANNEGYVEFSDLPFREFMLGYTARAYIRYRFNAAWSVGIEPAIRGQLMNSLGSGDLVRRATAKGVLISLSYRLR